ncbi:ead/Ea22-like family protein [Klebsiella pneumoniae]|uniref:ead/Ea22-like family protein n=1 Tax=Klebsiella pneumoniae TaxID=573 RepID=UPI002657CE64|nr:ead/Ea22-like family protein [Klebsiella pneumoniae]HCD1361078.1 ead/Ea22-like family protein [Klebsiella pneumoniae subsp. pneumoniae]EIV7916829.1 ead/Ea22-like family protein [Klebsiella pneumoniae]EIX9759626.1 ead/Ea22-like family protein [Klebsiella pneumoniae]MEA4301800.1 ead/Ea22-like family protein [Klebsiella pneumoniae]HDY4950230.1 ead/Ea22-like family protein [Klebsiella pneumoniae]
MTDITELAQSMKAAAKKATPGPWALARDRKTVVSNQSHPIANLSDAMHRMLADGTTGQDAEFISLANPANILSLVEALEKAQTINAAAEKLVRCKGRYHSEQNYRALAALFGVKTPDLPPLEHENVHYADAAEMEIAALRQRIAELESRTVKLPKLKMLEDYLAEVAIEERKQILVGVKLEFHRACVAAGIKVEAK